MTMNNIDGVILAAGRSSRMDSGHKLQAKLGDQPLLQHVISRLEPQVDSLVINADPEICSKQHYPLVADRLEGFRGPLMGLYTGLTNPYLSAAEHLMVVPCDGPFFPPNLAAQLLASMVTKNADIACIRYQGHIEPMFSLWHKRAVCAVEQELLDSQGGYRSLFEEIQTVYLEWPSQPINPFFNINTVDDLAEAERLLCL